MTKLAIFATIEVQAGTRDVAIRVLLAHRERCLREEPGTIQFDVLLPDERPMLPGAPTPDPNLNAIMLYEVYEDHTAFAAHWNSTTLAQARKDAGVKFVKVSGVPFQLVS